MKYRGTMRRFRQPAYAALAALFGMLTLLFGLLAFLLALGTVLQALDQAAPGHAAPLVVKIITFAIATVSGIVATVCGYLALKYVKAATGK